MQENMKTKMEIKFPVTDEILSITVNGTPMYSVECKQTGWSGSCKTYAGIVEKQRDLILKIFPEFSDQSFEITGEWVETFPSGSYTQRKKFTAISMLCAVNQRDFIRCLRDGNISINSLP